MPNSPQISEEKHIKELLERLIDRGRPQQFQLFLQKYHEADIADGLEALTLDEQLIFFRKIKPEIAAEILEEMIIDKQGELIAELKTEAAAKYIEEMDPDSAVDLLEELFETDEDKAQEIIEALPKKDADDIKELLSYEEGSAGAIMTSEVIAIPEDLSVKKALSEIKKMNPPDSEVAFYIYVINEKNQLKGFLSLRNLVMAPNTAAIKDIRNNNPIYASVDEDQEVVAKKIEKYDLVAIPVVDNKKHLVGLITVDDIVDVVIEEATEDLYKLSGTSDFDEHKLLEGNIIYSIKSRLPWLLITILGGILASYIMTRYAQQFDASFFTLALSLSFVPLLMGLGGNVGNQSATIIVRGLSTGHVKKDAPYIYIIRETCIGLVIGLIISTIVYLFNHLLIQNTLISNIVSISLTANITVAALIGSTLPIILDKLSIDPAVASAPFISTALDIIGQIIYFALTLSIIQALHP